MDVPEGLFDADTLARLDSVRERRLRVADLDVGVWGVIDVVVDQVHPPRTFRRKNGSDGTVSRVTLSDDTGTIDMVLWDGEGELTRGELAAGKRITIRGPTVKAGWKGGIELGLGAAIIEAKETADTTLRGTIVAIDDTEIVDGRFRAEVELGAKGETWRLVLWDEDIKAARDAGIGGAFAVAGEHHPSLDGWFIARACVS